MKRLLLCCSLVLALFTAVPVSAGVIVIGSAYSGGGNSIPFGPADWYQGQYQQVYSSSAFPGPVTITGLRFYNTQFDSGPQLLDGEWTIWLSTIQADVVSGDNHFLAPGPDRTEVFSGSLHQPWTFQAELVIPLNSPFLFDPSQGNLLMDVQASPSGRNGIIYFDVSLGPETGRIYIYYDDVPPAPWAEPGFGLVTGFETPAPPIPEPASLVLLGTGLAGAAGRAWRRRSR